MNNTINSELKKIIVEAVDGYSKILLFKNVEFDIIMQHYCINYSESILFKKSRTKKRGNNCIDTKLCKVLISLDAPLLKKFTLEGLQEDLICNELEKIWKLCVEYPFISESTINNLDLKNIIFKLEGEYKESAKLTDEDFKKYFELDENTYNSLKFRSYYSRKEIMEDLARREIK